MSDPAYGRHFERACIVSNRYWVRNAPLLSAWNLRIWSRDEVVFDATCSVWRPQAWLMWLLVHLLVKLPKRLRPIETIPYSWFTWGWA